MRENDTKKVVAEFSAVQSEATEHFMSKKKKQ